MGILFVDESGDPGFQFRPDKPKQGSTETLTLAGVLFESDAAYRQWRKVHKGWCTERGGGTPIKEFHWKGKGKQYREEFLERALQVPGWQFRAVVLRKMLLWHKDPESSYRRAADYLLNNVARLASETSLEKVRIFFDKRHLSRINEGLFEEMAMKEERQVHPTTLPSKVVENLFDKPHFVDSAESAGVQLADAVAGAVAAAHRTLRPAQRHHLEHLQGQYLPPQPFPKAPLAPRKPRGWTQVWPRN